jgi:hypothetical protein
MYPEVLIAPNAGVNYDLKLWLQYWTTETERFSQPPIYLALLRLFGLHVRLY